MPSFTLTRFLLHVDVQIIVWTYTPAKFALLNDVDLIDSSFQRIPSV